MAIQDSINTALSKGANPDAVLGEVVNQNPSLQAQVKAAQSQGAQPGDILSEIAKQNSGPSAEDTAQANIKQYGVPNPGIFDKASDAIGSFGLNAIHTVADPILGAVASGARAIQATPQIFSGKFQDAANTMAEPVHTPIFGFQQTQTNPALSPLQLTGRAAEAASLLVGGIGGGAAATDAGAGSILKATGEGALTGAGVGGLGSAGAAMQDPNATPSSILTAGVTGAGVGAATGGFLAGLPAAAESARSVFDPSVDSSGVASKILGSDAADFAKAKANPQAQAFDEGGKTFQQVVNNVKGAVDTFEDQSKAALKNVKDAIPDVPIDQSQIADKVNESIVNSVQNSAAYKGIKGQVLTPDDVVNKGVLDPHEVSVVNNAIDTVKNWSDNSARGVLNLKEALDRFYVSDANHGGSNAIVRSIQSGLKDLVGDVAPDIKPALQTASNNIDTAQEFKDQLLGKNDATGESRLMGLARGLSEPTKNGYKLGLIDQLKNLTGQDTLAELQGYADYLKSQQLSEPGITKPLEQLKFMAAQKLAKSSASRRIFGGKR